MIAEDPRDYGLTATDQRAAADRLYDAGDPRLPCEERVSEYYGRIRSRLRGLADAIDGPNVGESPTDDEDEDR